MTRPVNDGPSSEARRGMDDGTAWYERTPAARPVYIIHEGGDAPWTALCETCIDMTADPAAARRDIIRRDDAHHCFGCDYHADPACSGESWCTTAMTTTVSDDD